MMWCWFVPLLWTAVLGHPEVNHTHVQTAEHLRKKWSVDNVIRDMDHVKEDMAQVMELADLGQLTEKELAFYLIRMHDFDENNALDGIELRVALQHSVDHYSGPPGGEEGEGDLQMQKAIDGFLSLDLNLDGFVDYGEFLEQIGKKPRYEPEL